MEGMLALPLLAGLLGSTPGVGVVQFHTADPVAFVQTTTRSGTPIRWAKSCVFLRPSSDGPTDITPDQLAAAIALAKDAWPSATADCGYLTFIVEAPEPGELALDYVNRIVFREASWEYSHSAIGITTLFFIDQPGHPDDGVILDADIELNAVDFALASCTGAPGGCTTTGTGPVQDLADTLVHELGHLVGLDHNCWDGISSTRPVDQNGVPIPACSPASSLPQAIIDATMYPFSDAEDTRKRTPEAEDIAGFCAKYPSAADPMVCEPVSPGEPPGDDPPDRPFDPGACGCRANDTGGMVLGFLVALGLLRPRRANRDTACRDDDDGR
jgi:MYXO-CTERM domain-containing protein